MSSVHISVLQSDIFWEDKTASLRNYEQQLEALPPERQVVLLPEMFATGFTMNTKEMAEDMNGMTVNWMREQSKRSRCILGGSVIIKESLDPASQTKAESDLFVKNDGTIVQPFDSDPGQPPLDNSGPVNVPVDPTQNIIPEESIPGKIPVDTGMEDILLQSRKQETHADAATGGIPLETVLPEKGNERQTVYYNRFIWMLPNGQYYYYDKRHLFGFAGEDKYFQPGEKKLIVSVNGIRFCLLVCYDLRFPVWSRIKNEEYDVLVYVANWPEKRNHAWKTLLKARAIENQCYVIGVNRVGTDGKEIPYSGDSAIIDPAGIAIAEAGTGQETLKATLQLEELRSFRSHFPFLKDGDDFLIK